MAFPDDNSKTSDEFRQEGNIQFAAGRFLYALMNYNEALVRTGSDKIRISLIYGNRSAVYLMLKCFKYCLQNIDMAEKDYPRDKIQKLHDRRERCLKMMANSQDRTTIKNPFGEPFKLSYPANAKLPFFIDGIEMRETSKFGRHLITTKNLKAGDVVAVCEDCDLLPVVEFRFTSTECYNCIQSNNLNLFASDKFSDVLFCRETCENQYHAKTENLVMYELKSKLSEHSDRSLMPALKVFIEACFKFDGIAELKKFVNDHKNKRYTVFDFDWSNVDEETHFKNSLLCILGSSISKIFTDEMSSEVKVASKWLTDRLNDENEFKKKLLGELAQHRDFFEELFVVLYSALMESSRSFGVIFPDGIFQPISRTFHPCMLLFNHSCDSNLFHHVMNNTKQVLIANRPLKAGSQLFINYSNDGEYYNPGMKIIANMFGDGNYCNTYQRSCVPCEEGWTKSTSKKKYLIEMDHVVPIHSYEMPSKNIVKDADGKDVLAYDKHFKDCCDFINENFDGYENNVNVREKIVDQFLAMQKNLKMREFPYSLLLGD